MPKLKTKKSAAKRFSKSGTGKLLRSKAYRRHLLTHKSSKQKRGLCGKAPVYSGDVSRIERMVPYL
jgi:large subunit ribosomal protein L35